MTSFPFVSINNNFKIEIKTDFDFNQSNPLQFLYLYRYTILITNTGNVGARLLSRKWNIKDGNGKMEYVEGPGVIGETPYFAPQGKFQYQSFCPLPTMNGQMWGYFNMIDDEGREFVIDTPIFKFSVPEELIDIY